MSHYVQLDNVSSWKVTNTPCKFSVLTIPNNTVLFVCLIEEICEKHLQWTMQVGYQLCKVAKVLDVEFAGVVRCGWVVGRV